MGSWGALAGHLGVSEPKVVVMVKTVWPLRALMVRLTVGPHCVPHVCAQRCSVWEGLWRIG